MAIEVPDWWKERDKERVKIIDEIVSLLGLDEENEKALRDFLLAPRPNGESILGKLKEFQTLELLAEVVKGMSGQQKTHVLLLRSLLNSLSEYMWYKFKVESIGTPFSTAKQLVYDPEEQIIKIDE